MGDKKPSESSPGPRELNHTAAPESGVESEAIASAPVEAAAEPVPAEQPAETSSPIFPVESSDAAPEPAHETAPVPEVSSEPISDGAPVSEIPSEPVSESASRSEFSAAPVSETEAPPPLPSRPAEQDGAITAPRRGASFTSLVLAGLLGGAIVAVAAGSAWYTLRTDDEGVVDEVNARLAALELRVRDLGTRTAAEPTPVPELAALSGRLTAAEAAVTALTDRIARTDKHIEDIAAASARPRGEAPAAAVGVAPAALEAVSQRVGGMERTLAPLPQQVTATQQQVASLQQQITQRANAPVVDRAVRLAVVTAGLRDVALRGTPFAPELAAAKQLINDAPAFAPLDPYATSGIPSAAAIGGDLAAVVPAMLRAAELPVADSYLKRLEAEAKRFVQVRPINAAPGDDPAAVISRAETKARQADLGGALAELAKLPDPVRAPAQGWIKKAEARQAAVVAALRISASALAALASQ